MSDIRPLSHQEAFNIVWSAFVVNKQPPAVEGAHGEQICKLRTHDGHNCAVGLLVPFHLYHTALEAGLVSSPSTAKTLADLVETRRWAINDDEKVNDLKLILSEITVNFVAAIRSAHDSAFASTKYSEPSAFTANIEYRLRAIANDLALSIPGE